MQVMEPRFDRTRSNDDCENKTRMKKLAIEHLSHPGSFALVANVSLMILLAIVSTPAVRHPHFTGAWHSWIAGPLSDAPVNPADADGESQHLSIGSAAATSSSSSPATTPSSRRSRPNRVRAGDPRGGTEFHFRKDTEVRPFFPSTWPTLDKDRSMVFFYHDSETNRLRMHTIRD